MVKKFKNKFLFISLSFLQLNTKLCQKILGI